MFCTILVKTLIIWLPVKVFSHDVNENQVDVHRFHPEFFGRELCTLRPLEYGYYMGVNSLRYEQAEKCCFSKNMSVFSTPLDDDDTRTKVRNAILFTSSFNGREPIGRTGGLYILSNLTNTSETSCNYLYLFSLKTPSVKVQTGQNCLVRRRYLCQEHIIPTTSDEICSKVDYTHLELSIENHQLSYSSIPLPWRRALRCCERRGQILLRLRPLISPEIYSILQPDKSLVPFWTNGFKSAALVQTPSFQWLNSDQFLTHTSIEKRHRTELCVAADLKHSNGNFTGGLIDYPCESPLNFICYSGDSKCDTLDEFHVFDSVREFFISSGDLMSWDEARECCKKHGFRMLTVIEPSEGEALAHAIHANYSTGLSSGIWIGAKMTAPNEYSFVDLPGSPNHTIESEYLSSSRFVRGSGDCLTIIVDGRRSYAMHNANCSTDRSFICEAIPRRLYEPFVDIGARYIYGKAAMTQEAANESCSELGMQLYEMKDRQEAEIIASQISQYKNHTNLLGGFWSGHKPRKIPLHAIHFNLIEKYIRHPDSARQLSKMYQGSDFSLTEKICNFAFWSKKNSTNGIAKTVIKQWKRKCKLAAPFLCELLPKHYGGQECKLPPEEEIGDIWISEYTANWFEAKACCAKFSGGSFELISLNYALNSLSEELFTESDIFSRLYGIGLGFWTSGTNHATPIRFAWNSGFYSFLKTDRFYHRYLLPNETVHEHDQCLEGIYDPHMETVKVSHDDCFKRKQFVCMRKIDDNLKFPSCDKSVYQRIGNSSFFIGWDSMPFVRAAECCLARDAVLARIRNKNESSLLNYAIRKLPDGSMLDEPTRAVWIGLTKNEITGTLTWLDKVGRRELNVTEDYHGFTESRGTEVFHPEDEFDENESDHDVDYKSDINCVGVYTTNINRKEKLRWVVLPCNLHLRSICFVWNDVSNKLINI